MRVPKMVFLQPKFTAHHSTGGWEFGIAITSQFDPNYLCSLSVRAAYQYIIIINHLVMPYIVPPSDPDKYAYILGQNG